MDFLPAALRPAVVRSVDGGGALLLLSLAIIGAAFLFVREESGPGPQATVRLSATFESPEAVARAVVAGMGAGDLAALKALALTEAEFKDLVWPKLPASRPERNLPMDYVWGDLAGKSDANLRARLGGWQDREFVVMSVSFKGGIEDYGTFKVHRESTLLLKDREGREQTGRLFGSILEHGGRFKVFSYVVD